MTVIRSLRGFGRNLPLPQMILPPLQRNLSWCYFLPERWVWKYYYPLRCWIHRSISAWKTWYYYHRWRQPREAKATHRWKKILIPQMTRFLLCLCPMSSFFSSTASSFKRTTCSNYNLWGSFPFFRTNSLDGFDNIHALYHWSKDNVFVIQTGQRLLPCACTIKCLCEWKRKKFVSIFLDSVKFLESNWGLRQLLT